MQNSTKRLKVRKLKKFQFRISKDLLAKAKTTATSSGLNFSKYCRYLIVNDFEALKQTHNQ